MTVQRRQTGTATRRSFKPIRYTIVETAAPFLGQTRMAAKANPPAVMAPNRRQHRVLPLHRSTLVHLSDYNALSLGNGRYMNHTVVPCLRSLSEKKGSPAKGTIHLR